MGNKINTKETINLVITDTFHDLVAIGITSLVYTLNIYKQT